MADELNTSNAEVQQAVDAALKEQKKKKKKKRLIILAVIVVVLIAVIAIAGSGSDDGEASKVDTVSSDSVSSDETKQSSTFNKGDVVEVGNLKISFTDCNSNWTDYNEYSAPENGNKIIRAAFTFENIGSSDEILDTLDCYADNVSCEAYYFADDYKSPALESLSSGRVFNAVVYYEVPKNAENIVLEYETDYWSSKHIEFVIK